MLFFFKQKTAYEMRISDWSSDVCSSDLPVAANVMRMQVRVVELAPGLLRYAQPPGFREDIAALVRNSLQEATGERWQVERVNAEGAPTLVEQAEARKAADTQVLHTSPLVAATLAAFPGAELIEEIGRAHV